MRRLPGALRRFLLTVVLGGVAVGACLAALIPGATAISEAHYFTSDKVQDLKGLAQRSTIYDSANNVIGVLGLENREEASLDEVPPLIQNAVIASEDKTFWTNDGIDVNSVFRAFVENLTSGKIEQGGSTITQQLVKNRILNSKRDINRKVKEIVLAIRLNEKFSKREILEQYLNTVYFGQGSYGVKSAVERFFLVAEPGAEFPRGKTMAEVTPGEAALLAGLISNPEGNNPFLNPEGATRRRAFALGQMVDEGFITPEEEAAGNAEPLPTIKPVAELRPSSSWAEEVQDRLFKDPLYSVLGTTEQERRNNVLTGGLKIYASLDPRLQAAAQDAMNRVLPEKPGWTGSLVSIEPQTGLVKAMVSGPGFESSQYNIATSTPGRQAGSTWKVITLAAAMESGFSPADFVDGSSPCDFGPALGKTANAEGGRGRMTLRAATTGSVNCAYARTELAVGFNKVIDVAKKMGITQDTLKPILTLTLGTIESTATEMATVAATMASGGLHRPPAFISKIVGPDGEVVFDATRDIVPTRAISADSAACALDIMRGVVSGGTGTAARLNGRDSAGKTGTTDNKADANFLHITPTLVSFTWHGNALARIPGAGFGGQIPARISKLYMDAALTGTPPQAFPDPGPACARKGAFILPTGRSATDGGQLPGADTVPTVEPPTVIINPPSTTRPTSPPPSTSPPSTSATTTTTSPPPP
ncbi:MAG: transglycosylase domain-containing protein [Acidimicrobiia bacterium]